METSIDKLKDSYINLLIKEYKTDPNCAPELWIASEDLTPEEKQRFINICKYKPGTKVKILTGFAFETTILDTYSKHGETYASIKAQYSVFPIERPIRELKLI